MNPQVSNDVNAAANSFEQNTQVRISENTRALVAEIISSIIEDPLPSWRSDEKERQYIANSYAKSLELVFLQIRRAGENQTITAFDFLHWFGRNLESSFFCVINK